MTCTGSASAPTSSSCSLTSELHGIERFFAEVLPDNREMLVVLHDGFASTQRYDHGVVVVVEFPTSDWTLAP